MEVGREKESGEREVGRREEFVVNFHDCCAVRKNVMETKTGDGIKNSPNQV